jgi:SPP1 gp7 family putative phage head morphogenesis protein
MSLTAAVTIAQRYEKAIARLENKAIARLDQALGNAYSNLESEMRRLYPKLATKSSILQAQRQLLISQELGTLLQIINPAFNYQGMMMDLIFAATRSGGDLAVELIKAISPGSPASAFAALNIEAIAFSSKRAYELLERHGKDFANDASLTIGEGIAQGWGAGRIAPILRDRLNITRQRAEMIARTETIAALSGAAQQRYKEAQIEGVTWLPVKKNVCKYCAGRAMKVYALGSVMLPAHPNCRCTLMPWKAEWQELGLTDDAEAAAYRKEVLKLSPQTSNEANPFEKRVGLPAPVPIWQP